MPEKTLNTGICNKQVLGTSKTYYQLEKQNSSHGRSLQKKRYEGCSDNMKFSKNRIQPIQYVCSILLQQTM